MGIFWGFNVENCLLYVVCCGWCCTSTTPHATKLMMQHDITMIASTNADVTVYILNLVWRMHTSIRVDV